MKKTENVIKRLKDIPEEEQRAELIRLRDSLLDEIAVTQRVMAEYVKQAHTCTEILREMDSKRKGVKKYEPKAHPYSAFDDGDDWD